MKIRFLESVAASDFSYRIGEEAEIEDKQASAWIAAGVASMLDGQATAQPVSKKK